jgi:hypothetical protein
MNITTKKTLVVAAKPNGTFIRKEQSKSSYSRKIEILKELGMDVAQYLKDQRLKALFSESNFQTS